VIPPEAYVDLVARALAEDLGRVGDVTSQACVPEATGSVAHLVARVGGIVAGLEVAAHVFAVVDAEVAFEARAVDGDRVDKGQVVVVVAGQARSLLAAERTALNILGRMSGVATATAALVAAVEGTNARITDTRKTMPGMRLLDKHAVLMGGGVNHRFGLYDAVLIKDNHLAAVGGIQEAVSAARSRVGSEVMIEVEVDRVEQLDELLATDADRVLLDNMSLGQLREAVRIVGGRLVTEASGGVTIDNVRAIAETGVDLISVGWITHSPPQLDFALDFVSDRSRE
jgi:nicotinate-nucleotide pyrophosphorylase (carboxylating)